MILDKKGKLFGKISIVDISIILLVVLLVFGAYYKFAVLGKNTKAAKFDTIEYVMQINEIRQPTVDAIRVGQDVFDAKTGSFMGKIVSKEQKNAEELLTIGDGRIVLAQKPGKFDLFITISVPGVKTDYGYLANGNREINRDSLQSMETLLASFEGRARDIKITKKQ